MALLNLPLYMNAVWSSDAGHLAPADGVKPMPALPGPRGLPFIGNLTHMMSYSRPQTHIQWTTWAKQYGLLYR